jgi:hypothetical protein
MPVLVGSATEGLREFRRILAAAVVRRWPMYLRNVKQALRQTDATFDERAYGFGNLTDLLRAAHREGIVRVDRDRQGVIRVFQGNVPLPPAPQVAAEPPADGPDEVAVASAAAEIGVPLMPVEHDAAGSSGEPAIEAESEPAPAAPKKRRTRTPRSAASAPRTRRKKTQS